MGSLRPILLCAAFALALLTLLGGRPLLEPDEGRYAEIAREMYRGGSWLIPTQNGVPHFQKPPLIYWATASAFAVFGLNEFAARLPSALAAAGTLALTFWMGSLLANRRVGLAAAGILLASAEFFVLARGLTPDMLMTFWITLAVACFVRRSVAQRAGAANTTGWDYAFFAAMGLGFLTKGPMALVVPLAAVAAWKWSERQLPAERRTRGLPWVSGMLLTVVLAMSWFAVVALSDQALFDYFWKYELVQRFGSRTHGRSQPLLFFVPVLVAGSLPWLFLALGALLNWLGLRRAGWRPSPPGALVAGWVLLPLVLLSLSGSKLFTYVLPLFPALALWLAAGGRWADAAATEPKRPLAAFWNLWWRRIGLVCGLAFFASPGLATTAVSFTVKRWQELNLAPWFGLALGAWVLACCAAAWFLTVAGEKSHGDRWRSFEHAGGAVLAVFAVGLWLLVLSQQERINDRLGRQASTKSLALLARTQPDYAEAAVFSWRVRAQGFAFYLDRTIAAAREDSDVVLPPTPELAARLPENLAALDTHIGSRRAYGLTRRAIFAEDFEKRGWKQLGRAGDFVLITNR
ncbi:MAG: glycosyltransferase family 39 protein [Verrucomicrobia bacterium]|nr:glycosyltransferase family 39 protein [Verrucomicrobiota bacterium]